MTEPEYKIGSFIAGSIGKVVGIMWSQKDGWIYYLQFNNNLLTISEKDIDRLIIKLMRQCASVNNG